MSAFGSAMKLSWKFHVIFTAVNWFVTLTPHDLYKRPITRKRGFDTLSLLVGSKLL